MLINFQNLLMEALYVQLLCTALAAAPLASKGSVLKGASKESRIKIPRVSSRAQNFYPLLNYYEIN